MRSLWETTDFGRTVRDYEFTRKAVRQIGSVVYSADFEDKDSDTIFLYLLRGMELVSFKDYLKRYLYERSGIDLPFREVSDDVYRHMIMDAFAENGAPHSFEPVTKKWSAIVRRWLTQDSVKRQTVFLLGFGLRMQPDDVSEFLTKVLKEEDFVFSDPVETIYYYCYAHDLRYAQAQSLLEKYEQLDPDGKGSQNAAKKGLLQRLKGKDTKKQETEENREAAQKYPAGLTDEASLMQYLFDLKYQGGAENKRIIAWNTCMELEDRAKEIVAKIYTRDEEETGSGKCWNAKDITSADLEKVICSGIPVNGSGNLQKMSASVLNSHFSQRRLTRQRMDTLEKGQFPVERFDLITLLFFIYSQEMEEQEPEIRCRAYIDETNQILNRCGMLELYPVNPYEAFVLMCLLAECPLATYSDIWEMSYQE